MRHVVITGVSRGLGLAMTERFIELGHVLHGCARSQDRVAEMRARWGPPHSFETVDVTDDDGVRKWAGRVLAEAGHVDLLLNNAALINRPACVWEVSEQEFSSIVDVNIKGVANVIRHFVPAMVARRRGVIVNFSSGWGRSVSPQVGPYCCTKWAIEGLTKALATELPAGMAAIPLSPGIIDTDMLRTAWADDAAAYPQPQRWAEMAVPFLLSLGPKHNGKSLSIGDDD